MNPKYVHNPKHIVNFCNIVMRSEAKSYIKVVNGVKQFDHTKMSNEYIFQHCLEETDAYQSVLQGVLTWWDNYVEKYKLLK